jgi:hypothetical protein
MGKSRLGDFAGKCRYLAAPVPKRQAGAEAGNASWPHQQHCDDQGHADDNVVVINISIMVVPNFLGAPTRAAGTS